MDSPLNPPEIALDGTAFFLDIDGTLIEFAPEPDAVVVPPDLVESLRRIQTMTHGALALVSGRMVADIDRLFTPLKLAAVGGHGAEIRSRASGKVDVSRAIHLDDSLRTELRALADAHDGVLFEDKGYSIALHYRKAPQFEAAISTGVHALCAGWPSPVSVLPGKSVVEVKQPDINKGKAIRDLVKLPPFTGRAPLFIGDDTTDEAAMSTMPDLNGIGFSVGRDMKGSTFQFKSPADVREWLATISRGVED